MGVIRVSVLLIATTSENNSSFLFGQDIILSN